MKNITRVICLVLVIAMAALACVSCGMTVEERVAEAITKLSAQKKLDIEGTMTIKMDMGGMKIEMPVTLNSKTDMTDEANPAVYMLMSMSMMGESMEVEMLYKDGWLYASAYGEKVKSEVTYDEMMEDSAAATPDFSALLAEKKDALEEGVEITENEDGTLLVKMTFTKEEFGDELAKLIGDFSEGVIGEGELSIGDTVFEVAIDADNNITNIKTSMSVTVTVEGQTVEAVYDIDFKYNAIGDDFAINVPADADEYETVEY